MEGGKKQSTDTHWRCKNGQGKLQNSPIIWQKHVVYLKSYVMPSWSLSNLFSFLIFPLSCKNFKQFKWDYWIIDFSLLLHPSIHFLLPHYLHQFYTHILPPPYPPSLSYLFIHPSVNPLPSSLSRIHPLFYLPQRLGIGVSRSPSNSLWRQGS